MQPRKKINMLNTNNLKKTMWGSFLAIGGPPDDINPLQYSLYNFGGINSTELLDTGDPDQFQYLLVTSENYLTARAKNISINLNYDYPEKYEKMAFNIGFNRAKKELAKIAEEDFLKIDKIVEGYSYSFGRQDRDLSQLNTDYLEILGNLDLGVDKE